MGAWHKGTFLCPLDPSASELLEGQDTRVQHYLEGAIVHLPCQKAGFPQPNRIAGLRYKLSTNTGKKSMLKIALGKLQSPQKA